MKLGISYKTVSEVRNFTTQDVKLDPKVYITDVDKEGRWYYDASDTTSTDNLGTILVTASGARYKRIIVDYVYSEWFGATGNGSTDDTTAIQTALDFASANKYTFAFYKKTYKVSALTLSANTNIEGNKCTLAQTRPSGTALNVLILHNNVKINNVNIICDPVSNSATDNGAIYATQKRDISITNCYIKNHAIYGIKLDRCKFINIKDNRFWTNYQVSDLNSNSGIWTNSSDIYIYSSSPGFSESVIIEDNHCNSPFTSQGIWVNGNGYDRDILINNNHCKTTNEDGTIWTSTNYWLDLGSGFIRRHGIMSSYGNTVDSGGIVISNNICQVTVVSGIYLSGQGVGKGVIVNGNYCSDNGYATTSDVSLSGGISITGGVGTSQVINNQIVNFRNTTTLCGAINIQRNPSVNTFHSAKVYNNDIINSYGIGYRIQNSSDDIQIDGGSITNSTSHDIYYDNNIGTSDVSNWLTISNLNLVRSNLNKRSIWLDCVSPKKISINNVIVKGIDSTTNNSENYAIFVNKPNNTTLFVKGCVFENFYTIVYFFGLIRGRRKDISITDCYFKNATNAVFAEGKLEYQTFIVGSGNKYETITNITNYNNYKVFYEGIHHSDDTLTIKVPLLNITKGVWKRGDRVIFETPSVNNSETAVCTTTGILGTLSGVTGSIDITASGGTLANILTVNSVTDLDVGTVINIAGVTGSKTITNISGNVVTLNSNADATVTGAAISYGLATAVFINAPKLTTDTYVTLTGGESLTNKTINGVSLTTSGSATNFLNQQGNYVAISGGGDALVANPLSQFAATTSAQLAGVISDETGSGSLVFATSPTLVTPLLGVASAASINKLSITAPATGSTLTIADGKTLTSSNTLTFTGTDASSIAFGTGGTVLYTGSTLTADNLSGTIPTGVLGNSSHFIGTTSIALNRASASQALTGITSIDGFAAAVTLTADNTTNATNYPLFANAATGNVSPRTDTGFTYNPSTGVLTSTTFAGALSGNATTATTLQTGRTINGTTFDGSTNITITAAAGTLTGTTLNATVTGSSLTSVGTITSGTWSGSFGAVSGANLTNLTAANLSGTIPSAVLGNSSFFIGTTSIALNRSSANQALTGILSVQLTGATSGTTTIQPSAIAGTTTITFPAVTGTVITTGDSGTVTNTMLAGSIANAKLANSTISGVALGSNLNALTIGTGLTGTSYNGSGAVSIAIDSTVVTLSGSQTLTNKRINARVQSTTSTATFTFNFDTDDIGVITAQAAGLTVTTSGTPTSMQPFVLCVKDNGTARAITWNGIFVAIGVTLPTTTVINKHTYVSGYYNTTAAKVHIVGVTTEA